MSGGGTIGFGVFGYGFMGTAHLEALHAIPGARPVAVCGPRIDRAREVASQFNVPLATSDPAAVFEHPDIDAVIVDTPDAAHYALVMEAAAHGKHVFCEKPLAPDIEQARAMAATVQRAGLRSMMGFSTRFSPVIQEIKRLIDTEIVGQLYHVHVQSFNAGLLADPPRWSWRTDKARSGTGILGDLGSHVIDLNHLLIGPTTEVMASLRTFVPLLYEPETGASHPHEVDDDSTLLLRFAGCVHGSLSLSRLSTVDADYPIGRRHYLISGSKGGILWENGVATFHPLRGLPVRISGEPPLTEVDHHTFIVGWAKQNLLPFLEAIRSGTDRAPTIHDGLLAQEVIHAATCSAISGRWETVGP